MDKLAANMQCSSCGAAITKSMPIRREYRNRGFQFCALCVESSRAYIWAEEETERRGIRRMEKLARQLQKEKGPMHKEES